MARETHDSSPLQRHDYKQSSKLSQLHNTQLNLLTVTFHSDFPCHFKVDSDKPALTFRQSGRKIAPNTGASATKSFTLATKS